MQTTSACCIAPAPSARLASAQSVCLSSTCACWQVDDIEASGPVGHFEGLLEPLRSQHSWQIAAAVGGQAPVERQISPAPSLLSNESLSSSPVHSPLRAAMQAQTLQPSQSPEPQSGLPLHSYHTCRLPAH